MPLMNAPYVLNEIALALRELCETGESRTLFLSQFPMSEEDAVWLQQRLGKGSLTIQMNGASPTVWRESQIAGVWWGEYYESDGKKIMLRTIEITPMPQLAFTPAEDIRAGLEELRERLVDLTPPELAGEPVCTKPA